MEIKPASRYRFVIEVLVIAVLLCVGMLWIAPGPLFSLIMQDYGINRAMVSWTTSIVSLLMAIFAIPAGILASRIGLKRTFGIGIFLAAMGVLTPFCSNMAQLLATRVAFAIGAAMTIPVSGGLVMQWAIEKERPLINGLNMTGLPVGNAIALFTAVLLANAAGWRAPIAWYGAATLLFAIAWLFLGKERREYAGGPGAVASHSSISISAVLKRKSTLLLGLCTMGPYLLFMAIASWLPTYYTEVFHMPLSQASSITGLFTFFAIPACILGGLLPMRTGLRKPFLVIPGLLLGFAGLGTFLVNNLAVIYISIALFGICDFIFQPIVFTLAMELPGISPREASIVIAAAMGLGNLAGFTGPLIVGYLAEMSGSYLPGLVICSILSWSLLVGGLLLPETGPGAKRPKS